MEKANVKLLCASSRLTLKTVSLIHTLPPVTLNFEAHFNCMLFYSLNNKITLFVHRPIVHFYSFHPHFSIKSICM